MYDNVVEMVEPCQKNMHTKDFNWNNSKLKKRIQIFFAILHQKLLCSFLQALDQRQNRNQKLKKASHWESNDTIKWACKYCKKGWKQVKFNQSIFMQNWKSWSSEPMRQLTSRMVPFLGSIIRTLRSLQETTHLEPLQFHEALSGMSGNSISVIASPVPTFQITTLLSEPSQRWWIYKQICKNFARRVCKKKEENYFA